MIRAIKSLISVALISVAGMVFAAEPEDILMIEVAGQANGVIEIELLPEIAPAHVERIKILARDGVYNDVVFHRVIEGFMAQTGDVTFGKLEGYKQRYAGQGGSNYPDLPAEFSDVPYVKGVVGMARSRDPNSANSQFFIMFASEPQLDGQYTVFGRVIAGQDVVDSIKLGARNANGSVAKPDVMKRVWIKADQ